MFYATTGEVRRRAPAIPDDATGSQMVADGIQASQAEIDGKLRSRYAVPFSTVPKLVKTIAVDLAAGRALGSVFSGTGVDDQVKFSEYLEKRALDLLAMLVDGTILLEGETAGETLASAPPLVISTFGQSPKCSNFDPYGQTPFPELPGR